MIGNCAPPLFPLFGLSAINVVTRAGSGNLAVQIGYSTTMTSHNRQPVSFAVRRIRRRYIVVCVQILSIAEAKELLRLCKAGRLFEVQNWIASGKSLCVPDESKTTPLEVALNAGFHSLVELLLRNEENQQLKNRALQQAFSLKRLDLIELLVSHGAEIGQSRSLMCLRLGPDHYSLLP